MNQDEVAQLVLEFKRLQETHARVVGELYAVKSSVALLLALTACKAQPNDLADVLKGALLFLGNRTEVAGFDDRQSAGFHAASAFLLDAARLQAKFAPEELHELLRRYPDQFDVGRHPQ